MKPKTNTLLTPTTRKNKGLLISLGIVLALIFGVFGWWAYDNLRTYPLGDKMTYLGKEEIGGGLFFYATRYTQYYYGTDMTAAEVVGYFKEARIDNFEELNDIEERGGSPSLRLTNKKNGKSFVITYYNVARHAYRNIPPHIQWGSKKHVILLTNLDYEAAKESLQ